VQTELIFKSNLKANIYQQRSNRKRVNSADI